MQSNIKRSETNFASMLDEYDLILPERGQLLEGQVLYINEQGIFIDVGAKRDGVVPYDEVERLEDDIDQGDEVSVYVMGTAHNDQPLWVSIEKGLALQDWERAAELLNSDDIVELNVLKYNKGGILVEFNRLQGFVPHSHIPALRYMRNTDDRNRYKSKLIGNQIAVKPIEVDQKRKRLVFSQRLAQAYLEEEAIAELNVGEIMTGRVAQLTSYGAFINLGNIDGLLHISNIAWRHIKHPKEELEIGDEVTVKIEAIDMEKKHVNLNRKTLLPSPLEAFAEDNTEGDIVSGVIRSVHDFGAFVKVDEIEGLIPASEMRIGRDANPQDVLQSGDEVLVRILELLPEENRSVFSMSRVSMHEEMAWLNQRPLSETEEE